MSVAIVTVTSWTASSPSWAPTLSEHRFSEHANRQQEARRQPKRPMNHDVLLSCLLPFSQVPSWKIDPSARLLPTPVLLALRPFPVVHGTLGNLYVPRPCLLLCACLFVVHVTVSSRLCLLPVRLAILPLAREHDVLLHPIHDETLMSLIAAGLDRLGCWRGQTLERAIDNNARNRTSARQWHEKKTNF